MLTLVFGAGEETKQKALERTTKMYMNEQLKMQKVRDKIESKMKKQLAAEERLNTKLNKKALKRELKILSTSIIKSLSVSRKPSSTICCVGSKRHKNIISKMLELRSSENFDEEIVGWYDKEIMPKDKRSIIEIIFNPC